MAASHVLTFCFLLKLSVALYLTLETDKPFDWRSSKPCENATVYRLCVADSESVTLKCSCPACNSHPSRIIRNYWIYHVQVFESGSPRDVWNNMDFVISPSTDIRKFDCYYFRVTTNDGGLARLDLHSSAVKLKYYDCSDDVSNSDEEHESTPGSNVNLRCWDGDIEESSSIEWHYCQSRNPSKCETNLQNDSTNLTLSNVTMERVGFYRCSIWFDSANVRFTKYFKLSLLGPPFKPNLLSPPPSQVWSDRARIEWEIDPEHEYLIDNGTRLHFKYYTLNNNGTDQKTITMETNSLNNSILLDDLDPSTYYSLEMSQSNEYGMSEPSKIVFRTRNPELNDSNVEHDEEIIGVPESEIIFECYTFDSSCAFSWFKKHDRWIASEKHTRQRALYRYVNDNAKFGYHRCEARCPGDVSYKFVYLVSLVSKPEPPSRLECRPMENGFALQWNHSGYAKIEPSNVERSFASISVSYKIRYKKIGSTTEWQEKSIENGSNKMLNITNLQEKSFYTFQVSAYNKAGETEPVYTRCRTD